MTASRDDWRLQGQERYLAGAVLVRQRYVASPRNPNWDHDHCAFCSAKFVAEGVEGTLAEGYSTEDQYHWICEQCFAAFRERFRWVLKDD